MGHHPVNAMNLDDQIHDIVTSYARDASVINPEDHLLFDLRIDGDEASLT